MSETEGIQRVESSFGASSSSIPKQQQQQSVCFNHLDIPQLNTAQFRAQIRQFFPNSNIENTSKRVCIPPSHPKIPPLSPFSQIPVTQGPVNNQQVGGAHNFTNGHSRSLSQPSFFTLDSLPPLSPSSCRDPDQALGDVSMRERDASSRSLLPPSFGRGDSTRIPDSLPPCKTHRRSNSDIPFGFSTILQSSPPLIPLRTPNTFVKSEGEVVDDLLSTLMNLDNLDRLNSSRAENCEDLGSRASGAKPNGGDSSDNEATSSVNEKDNHMQGSGISSVSDKREGIKTSAGGDIAATTRDYRSVSMDSVMEKMNFADGSHTLSVDANTDTFSLEFGNGEFTGAELKKIMANEKLAEIALADPKRAKRILANRQSAARSKERKTRYITELEHKVQTLQTEATTLSAQVMLLQRDMAGLTSQNNELKFRLQAMEQQAQLRDALNKALTAEVQHLKMTNAELSGDATKISHLSFNPHMFELHHQQNGDATNTHE